MKNFDKAVWDKRKENIVRNGNFEKFMQNSALRSFLLSTGDKVLVEAQPDGSGLGNRTKKKIIPTPLTPKNGEDKISWDLF